MASPDFANGLFLLNILFLSDPYINFMMIGVSPLLDWGSGCAISTLLVVNLTLSLVLIMLMTNATKPL